MAWPQNALDGAVPRLPLVFIHHPPFDVGLPGMDAIKLQNGAAVLQLVAQSGGHMFCGHVHRTISGQARGVPFSMFKSPCHQAPLDLITHDSTLSVDEPAAYGVVLLTSGGATVTSGPDALPDAG